MKAVQGALTIALTALVALGIAAMAPVLNAAPGGTPGPPTTKIVELHCGHGLRASAAGDYGGVGFGLACNNGRARVSIADTGGTTYSVRIGVESDSTAFDCFFSGDSAVVNESCAGVRFRVR